MSSIRDRVKPTGSSSLKSPEPGDGYAFLPLITTHYALNFPNQHEIVPIREYSFFWHHFNHLIINILRTWRQFRYSLDNNKQTKTKHVRQQRHINLESL